MPVSLQDGEVAPDGVRPFKVRPLRERCYQYSGTSI
jgi:hypothetical protein